MDRQECLSYLKMKFSYNWIREYVEGLDTPAIKLESLITMKTAECEGIEKVGLYLADACTARVTRSRNTGLTEMMLDINAARSQ